MSTLSIVRPEILGDSNKFLAEFVDQDLLNFIAVITTITLASAANIHIELNKIELRAQKRILEKTRSSVRTAAFALVWVLFLSVILVVSKPLICTNAVCSSFANSIALTLVLIGILTIIDLTKLAFKISPLDLENK